MRTPDEPQQVLQQASHPRLRCAAQHLLDAWGSVGCGDGLIDSKQHRDPWQQGQLAPCKLASILRQPCTMAQLWAVSKWRCVQMPRLTPGLSQQGEAEEADSIERQHPSAVLPAVIPFLWPSRWVLGEEVMLGSSHGNILPTNLQCESWSRRQPPSRPCRQPHRDNRGDEPREECIQNGCHPLPALAGRQGVPRQQGDDLGAAVLRAAGEGAQAAVGTLLGVGTPVPLHSAVRTPAQ